MADVLNQSGLRALRGSGRAGDRIDSAGGLSLFNLTPQAFPRPTRVRPSPDARPIRADDPTEDAICGLSWIPRVDHDLESTYGRASAFGGDACPVVCGKLSAAQELASGAGPTAQQASPGSGSSLPFQAPAVHLQRGYFHARHDPPRARSPRCSRVDGFSIGGTGDRAGIAGGFGSTRADRWHSH